jgi:hypothetical protein
MSLSESLRRSSHVGLNVGLSLVEEQQILQMEEMQQKWRRVSLNNSFAKTGLNQLKSLQTQDRHQSVETLSNSHSVVSQSSLDSTVESNFEPLVKNLNQTNSRLNSKDSLIINNLCVNTCNTNSGTNSALTVVSTTTTTMLPIISYENIVIGRQNDINRVNRRMSGKSAQESFTCSQQSILSAMDRFVKSVNNMDSTVLVPSKLRDMDIPSPKLQRIPPALANTDLHSFYLMLNDVRKELLWGPGTGSVATANLIPFSGRSSPRELKHIRQPSDDSLGSLGSTASSSSDQDTDSEADSMITDRDSIDEHTSHLAAAFRHHLQGLHTILHQLADSADYLSSRYQEEIDASSL